MWKLRKELFAIPWVYSNGSGTPSSYTWSGINSLNQHASALTLPSNCAVTKLTAYAAAKSVAVNTRLVLWNVGGSAIVQSSTFSMPVGSESVGGQAWRITSTTHTVISSGGTYWVGLYRNPAGQHIMGVDSGGQNAYRKTNTAGFPSVSSMSGYSTHSGREASVGAFYITPPSAPSGISVTRNSDNSQKIDYTRNASTDQPVYYQTIERWDNITNNWYAIYNNSGDYTVGGSSSYTDNTTVANRQYKYRIAAWNSAGWSSYSSTVTIHTTPAAPTNVTATRTGGNVEVEWDDNSYNEDIFRIQRRESTDGGDTWGSWSDLTTEGTGTTSTTDVSPYSYGQYRVRAEEGTYQSPTLLSDYGESNEVVTLSTPDAPTGLSPDGGVFDADEAKTFSWNHNPTDNTAQTKFSLTYKLSGGSYPGTDPYDEESETDEYKEIPASTFTNGNDYVWKCKTWGEYSTGSAYSSESTFKTVSRPVGTITDPTIVSDYAYSSLTVTWTYTQAESEDQKQYLCKLYDSSDTLLETKQVSQVVTTGNSGTCTFDYTLEDSETYTVTLQVQEDNGLWSTETEVEFDTAFATPPTPTISLSLEVESGSISVSITNPTPGGGEVATDHNILYRSIDGGSWEVVQSAIPENTTVTDYIPSVGGNNNYYVEAVSATPSSANSAESDLDVELTGMFFINGGNGFEDYVRLVGDISISENINRDETIKQFAGRTYPVKYQGNSKIHSFSFSADCPVTKYDNLVEILESIGDIFYRDWRGRWFYALLSGSKFDIKDPQAYQFNTNVTRLEG